MRARFRYELDGDPDETFLVSELSYEPCAVALVCLCIGLAGAVLRNLEGGASWAFWITTLVMGIPLLAAAVGLVIELSGPGGRSRRSRPGGLGVGQWCEGRVDEWDLCPLSSRGVVAGASHGLKGGRCRG